MWHSLNYCLTATQSDEKRQCEHECSLTSEALVKLITYSSLSVFLRQLTLELTLSTLGLE